jgi:hypothetical protein
MTATWTGNRQPRQLLLCVDDVRADRAVPLAVIGCPLLAVIGLPPAAGDRAAPAAVVRATRIRRVHIIIISIAAPLRRRPWEQNHNSSKKDLTWKRSLG